MIHAGPSNTTVVGVEIDRVELDEALAVMPLPDVEAAMRIVDPASRLRSVVGAWLTRTVLAGYLQRPPRSVALTRSCEGCGHPSHGRPRMEDPEAPTFSLSHSGRLAVLACDVAANRVGVDVEQVRWVREARGLARTCLDERELAWWHHQTGNESRAFLWLWTRKEATAKLLGVGLARDFRSLHVWPDPPATSLVPEPDRDADLVSIVSLCLPESYVGHLATQATKTVVSQSA